MISIITHSYYLTSWGCRDLDTTVDSVEYISSKNGGRELTRTIDTVAGTGTFIRCATPHFDRSSYHHSWSISRLQAQRTAGIYDFRVTMKFCEGIHIQGESRDCLPSKDLKVQNVRSEARMIRNGQREWFSG